MHCTKTTYPHSKYNYVTCSKSVERFSDTPTNLTVPSTGVNQMPMSSMPPMVKPVSAELQGGVNQMPMSSMQPIVAAIPMVAAVSAELQGVNQMQNPTVDECDKTSLYYTIGVLVILLIILIGYTIYQSGKNSN